MTDHHIIFLELNEANEKFLKKYVEEGLLPNFQRIIGDGKLSSTHIPYCDENDPRFRRHLSPWIIWPTVYTGLSPSDHNLIGFGQDTKDVQGKFIWDVLDKAGISCGIFGCLMSYPPRGNLKFYVPESLAEAPLCRPVSLINLQKLFLFVTRNYSESFLASAFEALWLLLRAAPLGIKLNTILRVIFQQPAEWILGNRVRPERAMLHSFICLDVFSKLYKEHMPQFAALHLNHLAYMQHRYWRAAEPHTFQQELSSTDERFYDSVDERRADESKYADRIKQSYCWTDKLVGQAINLLPENGTLIIVTGLGQRPYDPVGEIHNPVVKLLQAEKLFQKLGLESFQVLHQMNPDLTINFRTDRDAYEAQSKINGLYIIEGAPLFFVDQRGSQLFLELEVPPEFEKDQNLVICHVDQAGFPVLASEYIWLSPTNEQSTANHEEKGFLLMWKKLSGSLTFADKMDVDQIAPLIMREFDLDPAVWHK